MKEFKTPNSGNKVIINCAPLKNVLKLKEVLAKEVIKYSLGIKLKDTAEPKGILNKEVDLLGLVDFIKNVILSIDMSEEFEEAIFDCLAYCTYKSVYKIDRELFDNKSVPEAREDYYDIIVACIEENLRPFAKSLVSVWKTLTSTGQIDQILSLL